ncbi:helix-turn-helix domain-containing protein [Castellaniella sp. GW247-6E4]|uniref:TetR/AcrR family transcriptional regulator n=1 Tax=Castellaniella sp. GW247-6E4 TaxID=3140380 RepID=UPI0033156BEE
MSAKLSKNAAAARYAQIIEAARWCFLNFGFSKTSLEDIARRAGISRSLLYRSFKDKEHLFVCVFEDLLMSGLPAARLAAGMPGSRAERLLGVCQAVLLEPWVEMATAPMANEFQDVCSRLSPDVAAQQRADVLQCVNLILEDAPASQVFLMALEGLLGDRPPADELRKRVAVLIERFAGPPAGGRP